MRYMGMVKMAEDVGPAPQGLIDAMGAEIERGFADGTLLDAGGLYPTAESVEFRMRARTVTKTDGPFAEGREVVGGYSIIEVRSHAEAVEAARRIAELHREHWPSWEGSVELRRISGPDEGPPRSDQP